MDTTKLDKSVSDIVGEPQDSEERMSTRDVPTKRLSGILDIMPEGHGYLRPHFLPDTNEDIYISQSQIRKFWLRPGDHVAGVGRPPKENERYHGLLKVEKVNGLDADKSKDRKWFSELTPIYPDKQLKLETDTETLSTRLI